MQKERVMKKVEVEVEVGVEATFSSFLFISLFCL